METDGATLRVLTRPPAGRPGGWLAPSLPSEGFPATKGSFEVSTGNSLQGHLRGGGGVGGSEGTSTPSLSGDAEARHSRGAARGTSQRRGRRVARAARGDALGESGARAASVVLVSVSDSWTALYTCHHERAEGAAVHALVTGDPRGAGDVVAGECDAAPAVTPVLRKVAPPLALTPGASLRRRRGDTPRVGAAAIEAYDRYVDDGGNCERRSRWARKPAARRRTSAAARRVAVAVRTPPTTRRSDFTRRPADEQQGDESPTLSPEPCG
ncbi:unnamed protein product [Lampetra planeri]